MCWISTSIWVLRTPNAGLNIVFVWSQYDGGNIDKEQWLRFPPKPNEAKLNIMEKRLILDPNIQHLDPIIPYLIYWKWLFWPGFGVRSTQMLVEIYNINVNKNLCVWNVFFLACESEVVKIVAKVKLPSNPQKLPWPIKHVKIILDGPLITMFVFLIPTYAGLS